MWKCRRQAQFPLPWSTGDPICCIQEPHGLQMEHSVDSVLSAMASGLSSGAGGREHWQEQVLIRINSSFFPCDPTWIRNSTPKSSRSPAPCRIQISQTSLWVKRGRMDIFLHFTGVTAGAQRGEAPCPKPHSYLMTRPPHSDPWPSEIEQYSCLPLDIPGILVPGFFKGTKTCRCSRPLQKYNDLVVV